MFIVTKDCDESYNTSFIERIFVLEKQGAGFSVSLRLNNSSQNTSPKTLGTYQSRERATIAFEKLMKQIRLGRCEVVYMPTDEEVDAVHPQEEHWHHATGKKTKGHGGS